MREPEKEQQLLFVRPHAPRNQQVKLIQSRRRFCTSTLAAAAADLRVSAVAVCGVNLKRKRLPARIQVHERRSQRLQPAAANFEFVDTPRSLFSMRDLDLI